MTELKNIPARIMATALFAVLVAMALYGCYYDKEDLLYHTSLTTDCATVSAKFSTDIAPLMQSKCATAGCHNAAGSAGGAVLETYAQIAGLAARINQRCVIEKTMPSGSALTGTEIAALSCWISAGAPQN
jgi:uncharacterized membrane protein